MDKLVILTSFAVDAEGQKNGEEGLDSVTSTDWSNIPKAGSTANRVFQTRC